MNRTRLPPNIGGRRGRKLGAAGFSGSAGASLVATGTFPAGADVCGGVTELRGRAA